MSILSSNWQHLTVFILVLIISLKLCWGGAAAVSSRQHSRPRRWYCSPISPCSCVPGLQGFVAVHWSANQQARYGLTPRINPYCSTSIPAHSGGTAKPKERPCEEAFDHLPHSPPTVREATDLAAWPNLWHLQSWFFSSVALPARCLSLTKFCRTVSATWRQRNNLNTMLTHCLMKKLAYVTFNTTCLLTHLTDLEHWIWILCLVWFPLVMHDIYRTNDLSAWYWNIYITENPWGQGADTGSVDKSQTHRRWSGRNLQYVFRKCLERSGQSIGQTQ